MYYFDRIGDVYEEKISKLILFYFRLHYICRSKIVLIGNVCVIELNFK